MALKKTPGPKVTKYSEPKPSGKVSRAQAKPFKGGPVLAPVALNKVSKAGQSTARPKGFGGAPTLIALPGMPKARGNGSLT
jgi:hypothetical protein